MKSTKNYALLESIEPRLMFDGNVSAALAGGNLVIKGDGADNLIRVTHRASGKIRIAGRDDTTVNGKSFVDLAQLTGDLMIDARQGGEDLMEVQGFLAVPGSLRGQIGAGELLVEGSAGP